MISDPVPVVLSPIGIDPGARAIAVALSGGPDSMALLHHLSSTSPDGFQIHALTVDHGLRPESVDEAKRVREWVSGWRNVAHHILVWDGDKPKTGIMEAARDARYRLMGEWCTAHGIKDIFLGHNLTDQAETVLFRIAKGSGLDGLRAMTDIASGLCILHRPFLGVPKQELENYCTVQSIPFVVDPTNANDAYARSRIRKSWPVLEEEGLTQRRLAVLASRCDRAVGALRDWTARAWAEIQIENTPDRIVLDLIQWRALPDEIGVRILRTAFDVLNRHPRLEQVEDLFRRMTETGSHRHTLGGLCVTIDQKTGRIVFEDEKPC